MLIRYRQIRTRICKTNSNLFYAMRRFRTSKKKTKDTQNWHSDFKYVFRRFVDTFSHRWGAGAPLVPNIQNAGEYIIRHSCPATAAAAIETEEFFHLLDTHSHERRYISSVHLLRGATHQNDVTLQYDAKLLGRKHIYHLHVLFMCACAPISSRLLLLLLHIFVSIYEFQPR